MNQPTSVSIKEFLDQDEQKDLLRLLTAGSVDDGKSTLIGRLLFDSKRIYEDQLSALERDSKREGHAGGGMDYALLLDGLKAEREQGITIDVAYRYFSTNKRKFIIADTPGHEQYTRNMVTGASTANLAILLVDARKGVITQTKRHSHIVSLLGIKHVVVAINKMDLVEYSEDAYNQIVKHYKRFIVGMNIPDVHFIPLSALNGDNVVDSSENMPWYKGKPLLDFLENVHVDSDRNFSDLRFPVQYVNRPSVDYRGFAGTVGSGVIRKGDTVKVLPSGKISKVNSILGAQGQQDFAFPPQAISITLEDEIDISRGDMLVHKDSQPRVERQFESMLVWMDEQSMKAHRMYYIKHANNTTKVRFDRIRYKVDVNTLEKKPGTPFELNEIGRVIITATRPLFFDPYERNASTGAFVIIDPVTHSTAAVGMIIDKVNPEDMHSRITDMERKKIMRGEALVSREEREKFYNQKGYTLWITGLHGSGKNELAYSLEKSLFDMGATVVLMDGSTVRSGLSRELDHSAPDRAEHLRRVAHVCKILNEQGVMVICSFISPKNSIRKQVEEIIGEKQFSLIHTHAPLDYCRNNKPEVYEKYDKRLVKNLPGVDVPYEEPENPAFRFDPKNKEQWTDEVIRYLKKMKIFPIEEER